MGHRRRSVHRGPRTFLKVTEAESTADAGALMRRVQRAIHEAEVLGLADVRDRLGEALALVSHHVSADPSIAGQGPASRSFGQHEPEPTPG